MKCCITLNFHYGPQWGVSYISAKSCREYLWESEICLLAILARQTIVQNRNWASYESQKLKEECLAFTQRGFTQDNSHFHYLSVRFCQKTGTGGEVLWLGFVCLQGLVGWWVGAPVALLRTGSEGLISWPWLMEANGRLAWEVSLPKQPLHPQPQARRASVAACCFSHTRARRNVCGGMSYCVHA